MWLGWHMEGGQNVWSGDQDKKRIEIKDDLLVGGPTIGKSAWKLDTSIAKEKGVTGVKGVKTTERRYNWLQINRYLNGFIVTPVNIYSTAVLNNNNNGFKMLAFFISCFQNRGIFL